LLTTERKSMWVSLYLLTKEARQSSGRKVV
jgi:hypothetical protein